MTGARRLLLIGGGHAHLEVLRAAGQQPFEGELSLISPSPIQLYSGMMPGQLREAWPESALSVDLPTLCQAAGARFIEATATRVHADATSVRVDTSEGEYTGSHASLDIGASASGLALPGVRTHAYTPKPLSAWRALLARANELAQQDNTAIECCVVGGGAAGVEIAIALATRLHRDRRAVSVTIVSATTHVPSGFSAAASPRLARALAPVFARHGIRILAGADVRAVTECAVELGDGRQLRSDMTVWATGASAPALIRDSALPTDAAGYLDVDRTLRATTGVPLWGAGDCISIANAPWMSKSGVYAVRAAPILAHNLRAAMASNPADARPFNPQRHTMFILDTADGAALLTWRGLVVHARWAQRLKRSIDERFVARYQR